MALPDFLCIGAQKAGTTWLHYNMRYHPGIWLPKRKEIHYFDKKLGVKICSDSNSFEGGDDVYLNEPKATKGRPSLFERAKKYTPDHIVWELKYRFLPMTDKWYESLFKSAKGRVTGDYTPDYSMLDDDAVKYAYNLMPQCKIIFIMRNPIERAWSHAKMDLAAHAGKSVNDIDEDAFMEHFRSPGALMRTNYVKTLMTWEKYFGSNVLPLFFDDIVNDPRTMIKKVYRFLNLDDSDLYIPDSIDKKVHVGQEMSIPYKYHKELYSIYSDQLQELSNRFDSYPTKWLKDAEEFINK